MWRRLLRDDKHMTSPARRCSFLLEGIGLCLESLGAAIRQSYDLEVAGAGAEQLSGIQIYTALLPIGLQQVKKVKQWQDE
ncbi:hypothetical protein BK139_00710 [Paenibacillus sp. FSL R5-0490]|nr:hypothetical protein BK139_00710 [Paenibacillus sp. FSL R5-0490]